jgi:uncharacterized membrane protein YphA (DoxX/SURF4 family)
MTVETLSTRQPGTRHWFAMPVRWLAVSLAAIMAFIVISEVRDIGSISAGLWTSAALGFAGSLYWTLQQSRLDSARLHDALRAVVRLGLGYIFISYGTSKLLDVQFAPATYYQLDRPLGELPGIQLTWLFFGYSHVYASFIGLSQIACSVLLFFRRTYLLGACLLMPIIGNIVFINFTHHIPVKLLSSIYLLATISLIVPELPRFKAFFWDHAPVPGRTFPAVGPRRRGLVAGMKAVYIAACFGWSFWVMSEIAKPTLPVKRPVSGAWHVVAFEKGTPPADVTGWQERWRRVLLESRFGGQDGFLKVGDETLKFKYRVDPAHRRLEMEPADRDKEKLAPFAGTYEKLPGDRLVLQGHLGAEPVRVTLERIRYTYPVPDA